MAGQFTEGNSGKPKGSRNKATIAIESLLEGQDREVAIRSSETMFVSSCKTAISAWRRQCLLHQLVVANKITPQ